MTLNLTPPTHTELKPRIIVFGVGGAGGNAVNNMIEKALEGADFVIANTDAQVLQQSKASTKIQMGVSLTQGLGAGAKAEVGKQAALESLDEIVEYLNGAHMCFITAGMGGGTGTGAAPIIAKAAREMGILTVGVVTKPFSFESRKRMKQAEAGIAVLQEEVDTLIVVPNENLFKLANEKTTVTEAFATADDVLYDGVKAITDLMVRPGLINLDFADVRSVMGERGKAMMGTSEASGENRAEIAAMGAISNQLLDEISLKGATGVLISIMGGEDITLLELYDAANKIQKEVNEDANVIVGHAHDPALEGIVRVSVVATGIRDENAVDIIPHKLEDVETSPEPEAEIEDAEYAHSHNAQTGVENEPPAFDNDTTQMQVGALFEKGSDELPFDHHNEEPQEENFAVVGTVESRNPEPHTQRPAGIPTPEVLERMKKAAANQPSRTQQDAVTPPPAQPVQKVKPWMGLFGTRPNNQQKDNIQTPMLGSINDVQDDRSYQAHHEQHEDVNTSFASHPWFRSQAN